jgi:hypothetical protein
MLLCSEGKVSVKPWGLRVVNFLRSFQLADAEEKEKEEEEGEEEEDDDDEEDEEKEDAGKPKSGQGKGKHIRDGLQIFCSFISPTFHLSCPPPLPLIKFIYSQVVVLAHAPNPVLFF